MGGMKMGVVTLWLLPVGYETKKKTKEEKF